jgi:HK97 gp10 family phage protein
MQRRQTVTIRGMDEVLARLRALDPQMQAAARDGLEAGADLMEAKIRKAAPVKSGALKASIRRGSVTGAGSRLRVEVKTDVRYASFVELGTSKMSARPFMRPGFKAAKNPALGAIKAELEDAMT